MTRNSQHGTQKPSAYLGLKTRMEKRLEVNLRQDYVNRKTTMLNSGIIPPGNSDINM